MKLFLLPLFLSTFLAFCQSGPFYIGQSPEIYYSLINGNSITTNKIIVGKTYILKETESFEIVTENKESDVTIHMCNDSIIKIYGGSEFRIDGINLDINNTNQFPQKLKYDGVVITLALLKGEADFITTTTNENSLYTVQTAISTVGLLQGNYCLRVDEEYTIMYVLEGKGVVYDGVSLKETIIDGGSVVGMFQSKNISTKAQQTFGEFLSTSVRTIKESDKKILSERFSLLKPKTNDVIFAVIDKKIIGIRLK